MKVLQLFLNNFSDHTLSVVYKFNNALLLTDLITMVYYTKNGLSIALVLIVFGSYRIYNNRNSLSLLIYL